METVTVLCGFGGQGLLFAGTVLAQAALDSGCHVSWLPSYGPEMRGGTASCTVIVADHAIGSPIADVADIVVALNPPSLARFEPLAATRGLLVLNDPVIEAEPQRTDLEVLRVACSTIARDVGDDRVVSIVALGAAIARRPVVTLAALMGAIRAVAAKAGAEAVARNERAALAGFLAGAGTPARGLASA